MYQACFEREQSRTKRSPACVYIQHMKKMKTVGRTGLQPFEEGAQSREQKSQSLCRKEKESQAQRYPACAKRVQRMGVEVSSSCRRREESGAEAPAYVEGEEGVGAQEYDELW